jgi:regulator of RNase E activity RraB
MQQRWVNFFRDFDGKPGSILLDLSYAVPQSDFPLLLTLTLKMKSPTPNGLSSRKEFPVLCEIEDLLESGPGRYVGRETTAGSRRYYFYLRDDDQTWLKQFRERFQDYHTTPSFRRDPSWSQYFDVLAPSDEEMETVKNARVIEVLEEHGEDLMIPRPVRHWIYFRHEVTREQYWRVCEAEGYEKECDFEGPEYDETFRYGLCITHISKVDHSSIDAAVQKLFRLAEDYGAIYDGWETEALANPN